MGARHRRWAAVAAEYRMPFFLGALAVLVNNGLVSLACGARRLQLWLGLRALRGWQCLHSASRWRPLQRWLFSPRLQLVLTGAVRNSKSVGGCSSASALANNGKFGASGGRSPHRSFSGRCSSHRLLGSSLGSLQRLLPNPSLVGAATGKALGPRTGQCHHPLRGPSAFPASAPQLKR